VPDDSSDAVDLVLPCRDLDGTLAFFTERLGFRLDMITPADEPAVAVVSGHGVRMRLDRAAGPSRTNGTWRIGRAGMRYRDLLPERGPFIASHILIPEGGPVPDYVHHHRIRFQTLYCASGWARLVYEDQGPPFLFAAGDCVLQPPGIRHRVLESSAGLEVIEVTSPAEHETLVDHDLELPTTTLDPARRFGGQRFVHHRAAAAEWQPWRAAGFECREAGIGAATDGLAEVRVVRPRRGPADSAAFEGHRGDWLFWCVVAGETEVRVGAVDPTRLERGGALTVPAGTEYALTAWSDDLELLEITLPAGLGAGQPLSVVDASR
jgi:mannose-6-phosphate isomerase-like protein (cupin superfamily)